MNYEQTLDYLYAKLPMYQRIGPAAYKKDLTNTLLLCKALGNPERKFKSIHLAGTNGKGSTSHMISAIYQSNGYKVGLYTSPHLVDFRERIKLNGEMCSKEFVVDFTKRITPLIEEIQPSFFEITVAMAFTYFAEQDVDIAIIETGLGGRLDSTNVIRPITSIITSIGFDHMDMLGDTLELIASEKAGIIKKAIPVVIGKLPEEAKKVITDKAHINEVPLYVPDFNQRIETDLLGKHQQSNAAVALQCVEINQKLFPTEKNNDLEALKNVCSITQFEGRWQTLHTKPLIICDVGHNEEGITCVVDELEKIQKEKIAILGFVQGKDLENIIPILPKIVRYYIVKPSIFRGRSEQEVAALFMEAGLETQVYSSIETAMKDAYSWAKENELRMIFVGGSNFVVADLLELRNKGRLAYQQN